MSTTDSAAMTTAGAVRDGVDAAAAQAFGQAHHDHPLPGWAAACPACNISTAEAFRQGYRAAIAALSPSPAEEAVKRVEALGEHMGGSGSSVYRKAAKLIRAALDPT